MLLARFSSVLNLPTLWSDSATRLPMDLGTIDELELRLTTSILLAAARAGQTVGK